MRLHNTLTQTLRFTFLAALLGTTLSTANAGLVKSDFLNPNDGYLVNDSVTNLQWLTPVYTRGQTYNNAFVQNVETLYGFRYATAAEVIAMVNNNFGNPTTVADGNVAGFNAAAAFFNLFGIAEQVFCSAGPCPRTQGLTSTPGSSGAHLGFGMIQLGSTGWFITNNNWPDSVGGDLQMGSFLVRNASVSQTPEPSTAGLLVIGASLVAASARRRRRNA